MWDEGVMNYWKVIWRRCSQRQWGKLRNTRCSVPCPRHEGMWENGSIAPLIHNFDNRQCGSPSECDREIRWRQITHHRI